MPKYDPQSAPSRGDPGPHEIRGSLASRVHTPNGTSIGSSVFGRLTVVTKIQTDTQTNRPRYVCNSRPHLVPCIADNTRRNINIGTHGLTGRQSVERIPPQRHTELGTVSKSASGRYLGLNLPYTARYLHVFPVFAFTFHASRLLDILRAASVLTLTTCFKHFIEFFAIYLFQLFTKIYPQGWIFVHFFLTLKGGSVAEWLACWTQA